MAHTIIPYNKVQTKNISVTPLQDNDRVQSQKIAYFSYEGKQFDIQSPHMILDNYGIPDDTSPYHQTVESRATLKHPLNVNPNVDGETEEDRAKRSVDLESFSQCLRNIDEWVQSPEIQKKLFVDKKGEYSAKEAKKYEGGYQSLAKTPIVNDDASDDSDDDGEVPPKKPDYMKARIPLNWETKNVEVDLYQKNDKDSSEYEQDGARTKLKITTLDDLRKYVGYMRKGKYIFHLCKLWASKQPAAGQSTRMYGITLKLRRVEVPQYTPKNQPEEVNATPFIDSDDEDDDNEQVMSSVSQNNKHFNAATPESEDSESDSGSDESDSPEPEKNLKEKTNKGKAAK